MIHLPNPLTKDPQHGSHLFLLAVLTEQFSASALWGVVEGQLQIVQRSEEHHWQDDETCVSAVDKSLQELGKQSENISQTLFALPSDWVDNNGIVMAKKRIFQKLTKELSLEPIGFVVTTEAMAQYLTKTSPQLNILLMEVGIGSMTIALVKTGQIIQTIKVGRSGDSVSDLREALAHIHETSLPAKIEIYSPSLSQEELSEVQQQLISFAWHDTYPFLHPPVIEVFETLTFLDIAVQTGGSAYVTSKGLLVATQEPVIAAAVHAAPAPMSAPMPARFTPTPTAEPVASVEPVSAAEMGFAVSSLSSPTNLKSETAVMPVVKEKKPEASLPIKKTARHFHPLQFLKAHLLYILVGVGAGIVTLILIAVFASQTMLRAKVTLTLEQKNLAKDILLTLNPQIAASDPDKLLLKATVVNQNEDGEKTVPTTGTKIIGDKALGTVMIYNYTSSQKTFAAGTKLTAGKIVVILKSDTTVASASSSLDNSNNMITKPGIQDTAAIAAAIGEDANLPSGTDFVIENYAKETYRAAGTSAFTGGSSREIQAVSAKDREQLLAALKKELMTKAASDTKAASANGQYAVPTNRVKVVNTTYSADVGKEVDSLSLSLSLQVELLQYQVADLQPLARQLLTKEVPEGYQLIDSPPQILSVPAATATSSAQVTLQTNLSTSAEPIIDVEAIKSQIAGKSITAATKTLQTNPAITQVSITLSPQIVGALFQTLPRQIQKIEVRK